MFPCVRPLSGTGTTRSLSRPLSRPRPVVLVRELLGIGNDGKAKATSGPQHQAEDQGGEDPDGLVELEDSTTMDGIHHALRGEARGRRRGSQCVDLLPDHRGGRRGEEGLEGEGQQEQRFVPGPPGQRQEDASFLYDERFMQTGQKRTRRSFNLAKNWQYKTVFSIRLALGHVPLVESIPSL